MEVLRCSRGLRLCGVSSGEGRNGRVFGWWHLATKSKRAERGVTATALSDEIVLTTLLSQGEMHFPEGGFWK